MGFIPDWRVYLLNLSDEDLFEAGIEYADEIEGVTHWKLWNIKFPVIIELSVEGVWFSSQVGCVMCKQTPEIKGRLIRFKEKPETGCIYNLPDIVKKAKETLAEKYLNVEGHTEAWIHLIGSRGDYIVTWRNCD